MDKVRYVLLSAAAICVVSKTFCGIGLSKIYENEHERDSIENEILSCDQVKRNKKSGYVWLLCGLFILLSWMITLLIIGL